MNKMAEICGIVNVEEDQLTKHRQEKKELQAEIQKLKYSVPKGDKKKKKEIMTRIAVLEAELEAKHETELKDLQNKLMAVEVTDKLSGLDNVLNDDCNEILENCQVTNSSEIFSKKQSKTQRRKEKKVQKEFEREERIQDQEIVNESGVRKIEEDKIKTILKCRGLVVHEIPSDGNCLYAAIADQLKRQSFESSVEKLRHDTAEHMKNHLNDFLPFLIKEETGETYSQDEFFKYCQQIESSCEWGGHTEIRALSDVLHFPIEIIQSNGPNILIGQSFRSDNSIPLTLSYHRHAYGLGEHYNSVIQKSSTDLDEEGFS